MQDASMYQERNSFSSHSSISWVGVGKAFFLLEEYSQTFDLRQSGFLFHLFSYCLGSRNLHLEPFPSADSVFPESGNCSNPSSIPPCLTWEGSHQAMGSRHGYKVQDCTLLAHCSGKMVTNYISLSWFWLKGFWLLTESTSSPSYYFLLLPVTC